MPCGEHLKALPQSEQLVQRTESGRRQWMVAHCEPVPHDLVHVDQAENAEVAQCTAQVCALQLRVSSRYGQA
jgi:hypothetical protein